MVSVGVRSEMPCREDLLSLCSHFTPLSETRRDHLWCLFPEAREGGSVRPVLSPCCVDSGVEPCSCTHPTSIFLRTFGSCFKLTIFTLCLKSSKFWRKHNGDEF